MDNGEDEEESMGEGVLKEISVTKFRRILEDFACRAYYGRERFVITWRNKPLIVVLGIEDYKDMGRSRGLKLILGIFDSFRTLIRRIRDKEDQGVPKKNFHNEPSEGIPIDWREDMEEITPNQMEKLKFYDSIASGKFRGRTIASADLKEIVRETLKENLSPFITHPAWDLHVDINEVQIHSDLIIINLGLDLIFPRIIPSSPDGICIEGDIVYLHRFVVGILKAYLPQIPILTWVGGEASHFSQTDAPEWRFSVRIHEVSIGPPICTVKMGLGISFPLTKQIEKLEKVQKSLKNEG